MQNIQSVVPGRYLIADPLLIREMEEQFSLIPDEENNWAKIYLDTVTGEKWRSYTLDSSSHGGGTPVFGKMPMPETEKLIDIIVTSKYEDEVYAASRILVENEETKGTDFRLTLINKLEQLNDKSRQISIIEYTDLDSPLNRKDILGKSYDEIISDANYYKDIADRSKKLM